MAVSADPQPGLPVLVILAPWADPDTIISRAGGQRIGPLTAPFAALAHSEDPSFAAHLQTLGVWAVRDASRLTQMCGVSS